MKDLPVYLQTPPKDTLGRGTTLRVSPKMASFIRYLLATRVYGPEVSKQILTQLQAKDDNGRPYMSMHRASDLITWLKAQPFKRKAL